jgi:glutamate--cysteine ligase regulatory subunit
LNEIPADQNVEGIKVVVKIFINRFYDESIKEIIEILPRMCVTKPSVILAYHPCEKSENSDKFIWGDDCQEYRNNFRKCWSDLRTAKSEGKISQLGVADIDLDSIQKMFDDDIGVDFTTLQINTQTCCVVPPELQQFCKERDIQLLTHSDPQGNLLLF